MAWMSFLSPALRQTTTTMQDYAADAQTDEGTRKAGNETSLRLGGDRQIKRTCSLSAALLFWELQQLPLIDAARFRHDMERGVVYRRRTEPRTKFIKHRPPNAQDYKLSGWSLDRRTHNFQQANRPRSWHRSFFSQRVQKNASVGA
jgi:hypothetical protein